MTNLEMKQLKEGEYFADYDKPTDYWCVFHTDYKTGFAFSSWNSQEQAEADATKRNGH